MSANLDVLTNQPVVIDNVRIESRILVVSASH